MLGIDSNIVDVHLGLMLVLMFMLVFNFIFCAIVRIAFSSSLIHLVIILVGSLYILCFLIISGLFLAVHVMIHSNF